MLVLSRKLGERILLFVPGVGTIAVSPVRMRADKVRLGIDAPQGVTILREELDPERPDLVGLLPIAPESPALGRSAMAVVETESTVDERQEGTDADAA
jgi:carbon storage regulator CsrA